MSREIDITVANVVADVRILNLPNLKLAEIARILCNVEHRSNECPHRLYLRLRNPKTTCLVYATGYITITGAKSIEDATRGLRRAARQVAKAAGFPNSKIGCVRVQTMTASHRIGRQVNILKFSETCKETMTYDPELFPSATLKLPNNRKMNIFYSGATYVVGCKSFDDIVNSYIELYYIVIPFLV